MTCMQELEQVALLSSRPRQLQALFARVKLAHNEAFLVRTLSFWLQVLCDFNSHSSRCMQALSHNCHQFSGIVLAPISAADKWAVFSSVVVTVHAC